MGTVAVCGVQNCSLEFSVKYHFSICAPSVYSFLSVWTQHVYFIFGLHSIGVIVDCVAQVLIGH